MSLRRERLDGRAGSVAVRSGRNRSESEPFSEPFSERVSDPVSERETVSRNLHLSRNTFRDVFSPFRTPTDGRRRIRSRPLARDQRFHFARRLVPRFRDESIAVVGCEHRREAADRRERQRAVREAGEEPRRASDGSSHLDPCVGCRLRKVKDLRAITEHRGAASTQIQPPQLRFGDVSDELRRDRPLPCDQFMETIEKQVVGDNCEEIEARNTGRQIDGRRIRSNVSVHDTLISRRFPTFLGGADTDIVRAFGTFGKSA